MIAIIGAGPAGIALGESLDARGVAYTIFERARVGATWHLAPRELKVLSPWWTNVLTTRDLFRHNLLAKISARAYFEYLERAAKRLRGAIVEHTEVTRLTPDRGGGWHLATSHSTHGPFRAVVVATGYFSNPSRPNPAIETDESVRILHAADLRGYDQLDSLVGRSGPVFVVGGRVTAGQTILALVERGVECGLCVRSPLHFRRHGAMSWLREMVYYVWEEIEAASRPGLRRNSYPPMEGGRNRTLVEEGKVPVHPPIKKISSGSVEFADGTSSPAAAVILATGYRPSLAIQGLETSFGPDGLPEMTGFEITSIPGVFLLGFDNLYDHRSRYLRGIRRDAARLAYRLSEFSAASESRQHRPLKKRGRTS